MSKQNNIDNVLNLIKESIYDDAKYIGKWQGFEVYEPLFNDDEVHYTGMPLYILKKGDVVRWNTINETRPLMSVFCVDEEDEEDDD